MALTDRMIAVLVGAAFGIALERAGLGSARTLTGQFLLRDFTVFKVMFSAIVTAMLSLFWLSRLGVVDPAMLYVPETYLLPQVAGGVLFGFGFAIGGLCPGTCCVAAAAGRLDGIAVAGGLFAGTLCAGLALPFFQTFYHSGARGVWTLPQVFDVSPGMAIFVVVAAAVAAFATIERVEQRG